MIGDYEKSAVDFAESIRLDPNNSFAFRTRGDSGQLCCIDTGCGAWPGGRLTAIDVLSGKIWQAGPRSKKTHY